MIPALRERLDTDEGREWVRRAVWAVAVLSLLSFVVRGATRPDDPYLAEEPTAAAAADPLGRRPLDGFGELAFTTIDPAGRVVGEWCALLADTDAARQRGLMGQTDLRGYDGMVFRFDAPTASGFWMKDTLIPLSIAWFDAEGRFVDAADMPPCPEGEDCPSFRPDGEYVTALEVVQGGLGALGVAEGAAISFGGGGCA